MHKKAKESNNHFSWQTHRIHSKIGQRKIILNQYEISTCSKQFIVYQIGEREVPF